MGGGLNASVGAASGAKALQPPDGRIVAHGVQGPAEEQSKAPSRALRQLVRGLRHPPRPVTLRPCSRSSTIRLFKRIVADVAKAPFAAGPRAMCRWIENRLNDKK